MLREIILLKEFKNNIPSEIRTHLEEQRVTELCAAGMMADSYELTHKKSSSNSNSSWWSDRHSSRTEVKPEVQGQSRFPPVSQGQSG